MSQNGHSEAIVIPQYAHTAATLAAQAPRQLDPDALREWILEKASPDHDLGQCILFSLTHESTRGPEVITQEMIPKAATGERRAKLANQIVEKFDRASRMTAEGSGSPSVQLFTVGAHTSAHRDKHAVCQEIFVVTPTPEISAMVTEQTGITGIVGHYQRTSTDLATMLLKHFELDKDRFVEREKALLERLDRIEAERFEMRQKHEALLDAAELRSIQSFKERQDIEFQSKAMMLALELGSTIVKEHFKIKGAAENPMLAFVSTLEPPQFIAFYASLTDAQREAFAPMLPQVLDALPPEKRAELESIMHLAVEQTATPQIGGEGEGST